MPATLSRRQFTLLAGSVAATPLLTTCVPAVAAPTPPLSVGALFAGRIDDHGFMEAGLRGLERARTELKVRTTYVDGVQPKKELLAAALTKLAGSGVDLVLAHGGQNKEACSEVAALHPKVKFVVTQSGVSDRNLASYEVLQEESAYLAGVLAALRTRTGVVGHMSGIRVRPGLKGRAAFVAGVKSVNANMLVLTNFSGDQDDTALAKRVARAQMAAGADIIFTMLNAGCAGVTAACQERGTRQIGNVLDWVAVDPQVFIASAVADVSMAVFEAVRETQAGTLSAGQVRKVGLANARAVRLTMAADVPADVRAAVAAVREDMVRGRVMVPEEFVGAEFATPA